MGIVSSLFVCIAFGAPPSAAGLAQPERLHRPPNVTRATLAYLLLKDPQAAESAQARPNLVEVGTVDRETHSGLLREITDSTLTLAMQDKETKIAVSELMEVRFKSATAALANQGENRLMQATLVDGTIIHCSRIRSVAGKVSLESSLAGPISIPLSLFASIRFATGEAEVDAAWNEHRRRDRKTDALIIRKEQDGKTELDHVDGVIGDMDESSVKFLFDGDEIPVKRKNLFGLIFFRRESRAAEPSCRMTSTASDVFQASRVFSDGRNVKAVLLSGPEISVPVDRLRELDFSVSKVRYLSDLEPREVKYTPFFDVVFELRRDRNLDGQPLRLGGTTYARGLALHSKTYLRYRISRTYRRFQTVIGIDQVIVDRNNGDVHIVISGDGKVLLETDVRGVDKPRPVDLDVAGIRDLEILVDFGGDLDIADHLDLADAKLIR